ncbi:MAG: proton-translocating transhydrogenase family protein [Holosporales bacterium]|jgi:NAD(P) transhydrogenase subunit alpha|nr:proton-translocating transhydrogenase family protein [Holosporales bacterium]
MISIDTITIFILACFVGYYVVLKVTPALHAPLMSVTNAISSVIIVVALDVAVIGSFASQNESLSSYFGIITVFLTMINIVGGIMLTKRMLEMFAKKKKSK